MINYNLKVLKFLPMNLFKILVALFITFIISISFDASQCYAQCNAKFTATVEGGKTGDEVTVKISVANFTDIGGIQWTMKWDQTVVNFISIQDFNLMDLSLGSFNLTKTAQGYFTTSWYNQTGVTKTDGSVIFTIKFKLVGADGKSSNIDFANTPLQIEISDKNANKCNNAVLMNGKINIGTVVNPPAGLGLKVSTISNAVKDQEVCVPVTVTGFKSITAMQFSFGWDTSKIKFTKLQNITGLMQFDNGNFGSALAPLGKISCVWIDQNTTGQTVADGKALFEICYTYKGTCPGTAAINITDDPTKVVFNSTTGALAVTKESGSISAVCNSTLTVAVSKTTHPCPGQTNGGIEISTSGGTGTLTYAWSNNSTVQNLSGVGNGSYNVIVKDGAGLTATLASSVVLSSLTVTSQQTEPTTGNNNGAITLTVNGGNAGAGFPKFSWSNNATTKDINNLAAGTYSYTVTDASNCGIGPISVSIGSVALDVTNITPAGPACAGASTGSIAITPVGGKSPYTFSWTGPNGYTSALEDLTGLKSGTYKVTIKDAANASKSSTDIILTEPSSPLSITGKLKQPTVTGNDGEISLTPNGGTPPVSYRWNDGSTSGNRTSLSAGDYTVTATDSKGCSTAATTFKLFNVNAGTCFSSIRAFTPNGDGVNELFLISCAETINNQLLVYNRWNQLVYTANNYRNDWTGIDNKGFLLPDGTYYWILKDNTTSGNANSLYKGYVTLIRTLN